MFTYLNKAERRYLQDILDIWEEGLSEFETESAQDETLDDDDFRSHIPIMEVQRYLLDSIRGKVTIDVRDSTTRFVRTLLHGVRRYVERS